MDLVEGAETLDTAIASRMHSFSSAVGSAADFATTVLDRLASINLRRQPNDGDLTGPFIPGDAMAHRGGAAGLHRLGDPRSTERAIAAGAYVFVNGIDSTLTDHYRAAQRLATDLGGSAVVVGVYNATAAKKTDLIQCAADKLFDRSNNLAVQTMTRLIRTYGDARKPNGGLRIYAHSQGSLIVSEALRQAQRSGTELQGNDVTTFGNAAFTYPAGPKDHHYIDDDAVATVARTGSTVSALMNREGFGKAVSQFFVGQTADVGESTAILHHGGGGIEPHLLNVPDGHDYIGDLSAFLGQGAREVRIQRSMPIWRRPVSVFGFARRAGRNAASDEISSRYAWLDKGIFGVGARIGQGSDQGYRGLSAVQREAQGTLPEIEPYALHERLLGDGGTGFELPREIGTKVGGRLGFDYCEARMHVGPDAASAARDLKAEAFTMGRDVFFGEGRYDPATSRGLGLIAHELTHVGQQTGIIGDRTRFFTQSGGDDMEREAQRTADLVLANGDHDGLSIGESHCIYLREDGGDVSSTDQQRLNAIAVMALNEAERRARPLGVEHGALSELTVDVVVDLKRMSDKDAAGAWADAILKQCQALKDSSLGQPQIQSSGQAIQRLMSPEAFRKSTSRFGQKRGKDLEPIDALLAAYDQASDRLQASLDKPLATARTVLDDLVAKLDALRVACGIYAGKRIDDVTEFGLQVDLELSAMRDLQQAVTLIEEAEDPTEPNRQIKAKQALTGIFIGQDKLVEAETKNFRPKQLDISGLIDRARFRGGDALERSTLVKSAIADDLDVVRATAANTATDPLLRQILQEVLGNEPQTYFEETRGMASGAILSSAADLARGITTPYRVEMQINQRLGSAERISSLVHEMTHISNQEQFKNTAMHLSFNAAKSDDEVLALSARRTAQAQRLIKRLTETRKGWTEQQYSVLEEKTNYPINPSGKNTLLSYANAFKTKMTAAEHKRLVDLAARGANNTLVEFDTVINQMMYLMTAWKVPTGNAFYKELRVIAQEAYDWRH